MALLHEPHRFLVGEQMRQLLLEHQRAARNGAEDGIALARIALEHRDVGVLVALDAFKVAELELRHATATLLLDEHVGDAVVREHGQQIVPDAGFVVVHVAGGEHRHLAARALAVRHHAVRGARRRPAKALGGQLGHPGLGVDAQRLVQQLAHDARSVQRIDSLHHDRNAGKAAVHVGAGPGNARRRPPRPA
jgi:hypothetical protein